MSICTRLVIVSSIPLRLFKERKPCQRRNSSVGANKKKVIFFMYYSNVWIKYIRSQKSMLDCHRRSRVVWRMCTWDRRSCEVVEKLKIVPSRFRLKLGILYLECTLNNLISISYRAMWFTAHFYAQTFPCRCVLFNLLCIFSLIETTKMRIKLY